MRFYLRVDDLTPFIDRSGHSLTYQRITPILNTETDLLSYYSKHLQERVQWCRDHCEADEFSVYCCQLCNGWITYNTIVVEFKHDTDALLFRLCWL